MLRTSESIKNIAPALLAAQKLMGAAKKDSKNPFYKSNYADLGSVMEVCKEALNQSGILVIQPSSIVEGKNCITTRLQHVSGEFYESDSEVVVSKQNDAQAKGAGETYTRRFSLQAFLFIPSEDDDGNLASGRSTAATPKPTPTPTVKPAVVTATPVASTPATPALVSTTPLPANAVQAQPLAKGLKPSTFRNKATPPATAQQTAATVAPADTNENAGW